VPQRRALLGLRKAPSLTTVVEILRKHYGRPLGPPSSDLFELILLENVAYLASPERKRLAFEKLKMTVGTQPLQIQSAQESLLKNVAAYGIIQKVTMSKLRECARIAIETFAGNVNVLLDETSERAVKQLQAFPSISKPSAEKILLFSNKLVALAPESNGIRVLARIGLIQEQKSYRKMYKETGVLSVCSKKTKAFREANLLLQLHGRSLCRRKNPRCADCPLQNACRYGQEKSRGT
jgi:endonuclease-3 related protein